MCFAIGQVEYRFAMDKTQKTDQQVMGWLYLGGTIVAALVMAIFTDIPSLAISTQQWGVLVYLGAVASGFGFFLWNKGARLVNSVHWLNLSQPQDPACRCSLVAHIWGKDQLGGTSDWWWDCRRCVVAARTSSKRCPIEIRRVDQDNLIQAYGSMNFIPNYFGVVLACIARYKPIEPATAAFNDPTCPAMGRLTRTSQLFRTSERIPSPSFPTTNTSGPSKRACAIGLDLRLLQTSDPRPFLL